MATRKKTQSMAVVVPKKILTAARSRPRPNDQLDEGDQIRTRQVYSLINNSVRNYREATNVVELMRHLARSEGPFSTALHNTVEVACTPYTVTAYDSVTHLFSSEGTSAAYSALTRLDTPFDYSGFSQKLSASATIKMMLREAMLTGLVASELVLDKALLPDSIQVVGAETLVWLADGEGGFYPGQQIAGKNEVVKLNIPTFFTGRVHPDPGSVEPRSMMEAALKMLVYFEELLEDIRRNVRVSGHNRMTVTLDAAKLKALAPRDVQSDPVKLQAFFEEVRGAVQNQLENIEPEQAIVLFDNAAVDVLESGMGVKVDYTPLLNVAVGQYATAMKTPPSVLGLRLESGSQALGNIETVMFLKSARALHEPVESVMNRALTLSCRLAGHDVYVEFKFEPLDLRPESELEAFRTMKEARTLQRLSLGFITDDEAANILGVFPRPVGAPKLSGTFFWENGSADDTPATQPGDTAAGRQLQPDKKIPRKGGGKSQ